MPDRQHRIETRTGWVHLMGTRDRRHVAACSCGWMGRDMPTEAAAERDGDEHVIAVS
jgi:hypothetical protein